MILLPPWSCCVSLGVLLGAALGFKGFSGLRGLVPCAPGKGWNPMLCSPGFAPKYCGLIAMPGWVNPMGWANPPVYGNPKGDGLKGWPKKFLLVFWVAGFVGLGLMGVRGKVLVLKPPGNWLVRGLIGFVGQELGFPFPMTQQATRPPALPVVKESGVLPRPRSSWAAWIYNRNQCVR